MKRWLSRLMVTVTFTVNNSSDCVNDGVLTLVWPAGVVLTYR